MKWFFTLVIALAAFTGFAQCPPTVVTPWVFNTLETLSHWSSAVHCFTSPCGVPPQFTTSRSNAFATALVGPVKVRITRANLSNVVVVTAVNKATCDTVYAAKCVGVLDSIRFFNPYEFTLWFEASDTSDTIVFVCSMTTGAVPPPYLCEGLGIGDVVMTQPTYRRMDLVRGTLSDPVAEQPQGLSLRSDGVKVMRQGVPDGLAMILMGVVVVCLSLPFLRKQFGIPVVAHPDDDDPD